MLCILAIYMAALICVVLTLFTSVVRREDGRRCWQ